MTALAKLLDLMHLARIKGKLRYRKQNRVRKIKARKTKAKLVEWLKRVFIITNDYCVYIQNLICYKIIKIITIEIE